jgi:copper(I)-binding protein
MFIDIDAQFRDGERIPVTLQFERQGDVAVVFIARPRPAEGAHSHDH